MNPPLKWHGGKHYLAPRLWELAEPVLGSVVHVGEPHCGGAAFVLEGLARGLEKSFWVNDIDGDLLNFWLVLQDRHRFPDFIRRVQAQPFAEASWRAAKKYLNGNPKFGDCTERAFRFFVRCRQSLAGRMDGFAPLSKTRTRRGMNEQCAAWLSAVEGLPAVHALLARVAILGPKDGIEVIRQQDGPQTLFYVDPPYLDETRADPKVYAHEMTVLQHSALLCCLEDVEGRFMLSGYHSALYDAFAWERGWKCHRFNLPNNAAGGPEKRRMTECVWTNF